jgi:exosortase/archaeosortase family protein
LIRHPAIYVGAFLTLFVALYALYHLASPLMPLYYAALAETVHGFLSWFDPAVGSSENYLLYDGLRRLVVVEGCDGVTFVVLILAAVLPFPASRRHKLIGLALLIPAVLLLNWVRLVILAVINFYFTASFDFVHVYLFQPLMIAATLIIFFLWMTWSNERPQET